MKPVKEYIATITEALKNANKYNSGLDAQIISLANAWRTVDMASAEIDTLERVTVMELTRYGEKMAPHPAFKVQKDAMDAVSRQMKILELTPEMLISDDEQAPIYALTEQLLEASSKPSIVKPRKSKKKTTKKPIK